MQINNSQYYHSIEEFGYFPDNESVDYNFNFGKVILSPMKINRNHKRWLWRWSQYILRKYKYDCQSISNFSFLLRTDCTRINITEHKPKDINGTKVGSKMGPLITSLLMRVIYYDRRNRTPKIMWRQLSCLHKFIVILVRRS